MHQSVLHLYFIFVKLSIWDPKPSSEQDGPSDVVEKADDEHNAVDSKE